MREAKSFSKAELKAPGLGEEGGTVVVVGGWVAGGGGGVFEPVVAMVVGGAVVVVVTVLDASATSSMVDGVIGAVMVVVVGIGWLQSTEADRWSDGENEKAPAIADAPIAATASRARTIRFGVVIERGTLTRGGDGMPSRAAHDSFQYSS